MINDIALWNAWERKNARQDLPDFHRNIALLDALYEHARSLGAFPLAEPLAGIDFKVGFAKALNGRRASRKDCGQP
jgi:hypothetical protein